ncbi:MAG: NAD-dependent epimerase/dehydratase family protein [Pirellulales bacterium]|nr:NAD-dependent epimerase/dehydratase family protein [Pirellulales bacterium]
MKALVTGANGFLGLYLVEMLVARGDRVRTFCRRPSPELDRLGVETVLGDIREKEAVASACRGAEVVYHAAAAAGIGGRWQDYYETNVVGTENVVEGCSAGGVGRLVYTSSPSVTFNGVDQKGVDESTSYAQRWLAPYPRSKAIAEQHVLAANGRDGLWTCALRPHLIFGPRDRHLIPRLLARARTGRLRRIGDGSNLIDIVYVENAAHAHLLAADTLGPGSPAAGRAYFISQGEPVNCWEWVDQILALAHLPPVGPSISPAAAWWLGAALETVYRLFRIPGDPPMTRFLAAQLTTSHYFDIRGARQDLGYEPRISTADGMQRLASELSLSSF